VCSADTKVIFTHISLDRLYAESKREKYKLDAVSLAKVILRLKYLFSSVLSLSHDVCFFRTHSERGQYTFRKNKALRLPLSGPSRVEQNIFLNIDK
jgi:hypothetical protein